MICRLLTVAGLVAFMTSSAPAEGAGAQGARPASGYRCSFEERGGYGVIVAEVEVDSAGQQSGRVSWDAGDGGFRDPSIRAHWFRRRGAAFRLDAGAVWIEWYNPVPPGPRPSRAIRIELRTNLETTYVSHARLATQRQRYRGGPVHLRLDWSEVSALAQGADRLFLVTRGNDNTVLHHLEIDRTIFIRSRREIESALERMNQMVADPPRYCAFEENLREEENIVVT